MSAPTTPTPAPVREALDHRQRAALTALRSNAWAELVYLEAHLGDYYIAEALGYDRHSKAARTQRFSRNRLWKLRLMVRLTAALHETQPHHVASAWFSMIDPHLVSDSPMTLLASAKYEDREQVEQRLVDALKDFLEIPPQETAS